MSAYLPGYTRPHPGGALDINSGPSSSQARKKGIANARRFNQLIDDRGVDERVMGVGLPLIRLRLFPLSRREPSASHAEGTDTSLGTAQKNSRGPAPKSQTGGAHGIDSLAALPSTRVTLVGLPRPATSRPQSTDLNPQMPSHRNSQTSAHTHLPSMVGLVASPLSPRSRGAVWRLGLPRGCLHFRTRVVGRSCRPLAPDTPRPPDPCTLRRPLLR